jgi:uncharacterized repeat protein (TIGR03943 family)
VLAIWTFFLIYLLASQRYLAFLRPEFGFLLAIAHFIAMGFGIAATVRSETARMDMSAVLRALTLLVPIVYFMAIPDAMLGDQAFKKRFTGIANPAVGRSDRSIPALSEAETSARRERPQERTILDIFLNPDLYAGQRIVITGMILRDEGLKLHFGGMDTAVYRFLINCCAADAMPLAIALDLDRPGAFDKDQWVQVDGIFTLRQIDGKSVPMVLQPSIKTIEAPAVPYLF